MFARKDEKPLPPVNLLGDFAGGGLMCAFGIVLALFERNQSGRGQVIDSAMIDGAAYLSTFIHKHYKAGIWSIDSGTNMLDTGAPFYEVYETKDNRHVSVGAIEPQFYAQLITGLGFDSVDLPDQHDRDQWPKLKEIFEKKFKQKTLGEWRSIFDETDACVAPVLKLTDLMDHPHNKERQLVSPFDSLPTPAPRLSRTPAQTVSGDEKDFEPGTHSIQILEKFGFSSEDIRSFAQNNVIGGAKSKL